MAAYPTIPNVIRATFQWYDGVGHFGGRLFFAAVGAPWVASDLNTFATDISSSWSTHMAQDVSGSYFLVSIVTQDMSAVDGYQGRWAGSIQGTVSGYQLPSSNCVNIRSIVSKHYRGGHPVFHHPPAASQELSNPRLWSSTYAAGVTTHFEAFLSQIEGLTVGGISTVSHVAVLGWKPGGTSGEITLEPPINYVVPTRVGTMRRRLATES